MDNSVGHQIDLSAGNLSKFSLEIFSFLKDNPPFSGIIKSKTSYVLSYVLDLGHRPSGEGIVGRIESLEKPGRMCVLDWTTSSPMDAAEAANLSVCFGLNSAGVIAGLLGLKAIHWDCMGWLKCSVYRGKDQEVF